MRKGKIVAFRGNYMSGLAVLEIDTESAPGSPHRYMAMVPCQNTYTVRALESAFGNVIGEAHNVLENGGHVGKEVYYTVDEAGVLDGFSPAEDAPTKVKEQYQSQKAQEAEG